MRCPTAFLVPVLVVAGLAGPARGQVDLKTWAAGMDSTWNVNENWSPWGVPNNAGGFEYEAFVDDSHIVSLDLSATVTNLSLSNGSQLWIGNGKTFSLWGATTDPDGANVHNQGTVRVYAEGTSTRIHINQGPVTFSSTEGGEVFMEAGTGSGYSEVFGSGVPTAPRVVNNAGHTFRGAGFFRNSCNITNHGLISADNPDKAIEIRPPSMAAGGDCTNDGTLRAENGATLMLLRSAFTVTSQYLNTGGVIEAMDGSTVELDGRARFVGGELATAGTGVVHVLDDFCVLSDIGNSGTLRIDPGARVDIVGAIANSGTIWVDTVAPNAGGGLRLLSEGDVTLSGGGTIDLGDNVNNKLLSTTAGRRLTNVDNTIRGAGNIGDNSLSVTNQGVIEADGATEILRINPPPSGDFTNEGMLHAITSPGLEIDPGPFTTSGQVIVDAGSSLSRVETYQQDGGSTTVNGTLTVLSGSLSLAGGALNGNGHITATVVNSGGAVEPGTSAGLLTITGTYTQAAGGAMTVELGGTAPGTGHDQLVVSGDVALDGALDVATINGFEPGDGDTFTIITSTGAITGAFSLVTPANGFTVTYLPDAVVLSDFGTACSSDCDGSNDGIVGVDDFLAVLAQWGTTGSCDIDGGGGGVGVDDFLAILAAWGSCP